MRARRSTPKLDTLDCMSRARSSTLRHLQKLAVTTIVTVACNSGYGDGDPIPPPAKCASISALKGSAIWKKDVDGGFGVQLIITITKTDPGTTLAVLPSVGSSVDGSGNLTIVVPAASSESSVYFTLTMTCAAGKDSHQIAVQWSTPPVDGRSETVTIY